MEGRKEGTFFFYEECSYPETWPDFRG